MARAEPESNRQLYEVEAISIETMAEIFKVHPAWADLSNPDSKLYKFLMSEFADKDNDGKLSVRKLRAIAILWCDGDNDEKVVEFYENCQPSM